MFFFFFSDVHLGPLYTFFFNPGICRGHVSSTWSLVKFIPLDFQLTFFKFTNFPFLLCDDFWGFFLQQKQAMDHLKGIKVIRAFVFLGRCFWRFLFRLEKSSGLPALKKFTELRLLTRLLPTSVGPFTRRNWFAVGWPVGSPGRKSGSGDQGRCPNGSMIFSGKADVKPQWISNKCRSFHNSKVAMDGFLPRVVFVDILFCRKNGVVFTSQKVLWWKFKPFFLCVCVCVSEFCDNVPNKNNGAFDIVPLVTYPYWIWKICRSKDCPSGCSNIFPCDRCTTRHSIYFFWNVFFWLRFEEVGFPMLGFNDLMYCVVSKMGNAWFVFMFGICFRYFNAKHRSEVSANKLENIVFDSHHLGF